MLRLALSRQQSNQFLVGNQNSMNLQLNSTCYQMLPWLCLWTGKHLEVTVVVTLCYVNKMQLYCGFVSRFVSLFWGSYFIYSMQTCCWKLLLWEIYLSSPYPYFHCSILYHHIFLRSLGLSTVVSVLSAFRSRNLKVIQVFMSIRHSCSLTNWKTF